MTSNNKRILSRRSFIKQASAAAIAPAIIPSSALGLAGTVAPSNRIVMGSIAVGGQARHLIGSAIQQPDTQIVALCDVNRVTVEAEKAKVDAYYDNQDCALYADFRELTARKDVDALIVAPPDHWHAIPCILAAKAGKDVYCEKPLTHTLKEGRAVVDAVHANHIILQVGSMQRTQRDMKRACELVRNGYLGKITHINVGLPNGGHRHFVSTFPAPPETLDYEMWVGPARWAPYHPKRLDWNWRWYMEFGGGNLMDWIGHHGDIAHMGMGWDEIGPVRIEPEIWTLETELHPPSNRVNLYNDPLSYRSRLTYAGGVTMTIGSMGVMPSVFTDNGETGTQWFGENGDWVYVSREKIASNNPKLMEVEFAPGDFRFTAEENHMRDFLDCVKSRKQPSAPAEAGHRSASLGHLSKIACELGKTLEWDHKAEKFTNSKKANRLLGRENRGNWTIK